MESKFKKSGFTLIETLIAISIFAIYALAVFYSTASTLKRTNQNQKRNEAQLYAQEGLEAVRNMRDRNFLNLANGDHGLKFENNEWVFIPAPEHIGGEYERTLVISDVYRDALGNISETGIYDPESKKITSTVSWNLDSITADSTSLSTYLSNWTGDDVIQTSCSEFSSGVFSETTTVVSDAPPPDNCAIQLSAILIQGDFFDTVHVGHHGNNVFVDGNYAYVATNLTNSGLTVVDVSDVENPVILKQINVGGMGKYITKAGDYVYLGVQDKSKGLAIVNVSDPANPQLVKSFDIGDLGGPIAVSGNTLIMGTGKSSKSLQIVNVAVKLVPVITHTLDLNGIVQAVEISGDYIYLGMETDSNAFKVLKMDPSPRIVSSLHLGEEINAIQLNGPIAYIGIEDSGNSLHLVDIGTPETPNFITSIDVGGEIQDLTFEDDSLYAAIDEIKSGLSVVYIGNPVAPVLEYTMDIEGKATGIDSDPAHVFITLSVNNRGLVITGTSSPGVSSAGTYISEIIDTLSEDTRYNFIEWDHMEVPTGSVKFQIKTAASQSEIASAAWVGSDGTNASFYENPRTKITLDPGRTGNRFFQVKGFIASDGVSTPVIESIRVNFNP